MACSVIRCGVSSASCKTVCLGLSIAARCCAKYRLDVVTQLAHARLRLQHFREQFEQGGFSRAVWTDEHSALAAFALEIQVFVNQFAGLAPALVASSPGLRPPSPPFGMEERDGVRRPSDLIP